MKWTVVIRFLVVVLIATAVTGLFVFAGEDAELETLGPTPEEMQEVVAASNEFAWKVFQQVAAGSEENVCFSPSSIHTALTMTYTGSAGETAKQMHAALSLPSEELMAHVEQADPPAVGTYFVGQPWDRERLGAAYGGLLAALKPGKKAKFELRVANALWGQDDCPWRDRFTDGLKDYYGAGLREVDFADDADDVADDVNDWVDDQTRGKIEKVIPDGVLNELTRLVLVNAVYFKGKWVEPFKTRNTRPSPFHLSAEKTVDVPTMFQSESFKYAETDLMQVVRMPYQGNEVSMLIFLPRAIDGLAGVEAWLAEADLAEVLESMTFEDVNVSLPKFKFRWRSGLNDALKAIGMAGAFDQTQADFGDMASSGPEGPLFISSVLHAAFIEVDEAGTEAAAATAIVVEEACEPAPPKQFRADHPFAFAIRHEETGLLLFVGRVADPKAEEQE